MNLPPPALRRVVVTGYGALTPFGRGADALWTGLIGKLSAIHRVERLARLGLPVSIAATLDDAFFHQSGDAPRPYQMAFDAAGEAVRLAGWDEGILQSTALFSAIGWEWKSLQTEENTGKTDAFFDTKKLAAELKIGGVTGESYAACAASTMAIGEAFHLIRTGEADAALAGGADSRANELGLLAYAKLGALATGWEDRPEQASRPFDKKRNGFVIGEGAGFLALESLDHARNRGAKIHAEILSASSTMDAFRVTDPEPTGKQAARCMSLVLERAGVTAAEVSGICCHATSTPANDSAEHAAMRKVFGDRLSAIPLLAPKSNFGHLAMACGAVETVVTVLSLIHGTVPPICLLKEPEFDLALPNGPVKLGRLSMILKNSFGFGGQNAALLLRGWSENPIA